MTFLPIHHMKVVHQWFSKWAKSPQVGDFEGQGGEKTNGAIGEQSNTKGAKTLNHYQ